MVEVVEHMNSQEFVIKQDIMVDLLAVEHHIHSLVQVVDHLHNLVLH